MEMVPSKKRLQNTPRFRSSQSQNAGLPELEGKKTGVPHYTAIICRQGVALVSLYDGKDLTKRYGDRTGGYGLSFEMPGWACLLGHQRRGNDDTSA